MEPTVKKKKKLLLVREHLTCVMPIQATITAAHIPGTTPLHISSDPLEKNTLMASEGTHPIHLN